ncbi:paraneoplastic Ma antigen [Perkinsus olseni]|uniref:Paraneoplastic Ma antigen n=1 Tax=Perkinsus olseni TaxID=32597 RepID=A0A7J6TDZ8_PEROL|nr:paraneoplastic Ma antigen [Perkinsus olseni]
MDPNLYFALPECYDPLTTTLDFEQWVRKFKACAAANQAYLELQADQVKPIILTAFIRGLKGHSVDLARKVRNAYPTSIQAALEKAQFILSDPFSDARQDHDPGLVAISTSEDLPQAHTEPEHSSDGVENEPVWVDKIVAAIQGSRKLCHYCGRPGHFEKNCFKKARDKRAGEKRPRASSTSSGTNYEGDADGLPKATPSTALLDTGSSVSLVDRSVLSFLPIDYSINTRPPHLSQVLRGKGKLLYPVILGRDLVRANNLGIAFDDLSIGEKSQSSVVAAVNQNWRALPDGWKVKEVVHDDNKLYIVAAQPVLDKDGQHPARFYVAFNPDLIKPPSRAEQLGALRPHKKLLEATNGAQDAAKGIFKQWIHEGRLCPAKALISTLITKSRCYSYVTLNDLRDAFMHLWILPSNRQYYLVNPESGSPIPSTMTQRSMLSTVCPMGRATVLENWKLLYSG